MESRVAQRYVKPLLSLAIEQGALEQVHDDMKMFSKVCEENRSFALMLKNPVIKHDTKREILHKIFEGRVHKLTMSIFDIITRKNREPLLPFIAREFHNAYNTYKNIGKASLKTSFAIDDELRKEFQKIVGNITHTKDVELLEHVDQDLIGGFILNIGDKQIDASIRSKLKQLRVKLSDNPYIREI